jgi:hypothetical protein
MGAGRVIHPLVATNWFTIQEGRGVVSRQRME